MVRETCLIIYYCPHCGAPITIIGDPAPADKLLASYLGRRPVCADCKRMLSLSL